MRGLAQGLSVVALCISPEAVAQTLELRVVEERTGRPLAGVVVRLEQNGRPVVMGLSNEAGRLQLRAPSPGHYRVRAGRIGFESPPPFSLDLSGTVQRQIEMPGQIRQLPAITVSGTTRCAAQPTGGSLAAALWEEVQLALTANRITMEQGLQVVHAVRFERYLTSNRGLLRERITGSMVTTGQPFVSPPADQLARQGFVAVSGDSVVYSAPDAALLLADEFVRSHCFEVDPRGSDRALVGLSFAPLPDAHRSDVAGTLWIDRESRELLHLEYRYTGLTGPAGFGGPGGEIHFLRLPSGSWIVREWVIRMPRTAERRDLPHEGQQLVITGWLEQGGRASVTPAATPGLNQGSLVEGETFDSLHQAPLVGAVITIDGEPDSAFTDSTGRFRLTSRARGSRLLRTTHPLLGIVSDNSTQQISLVPGRSVQAHIDVPSAASFARILCGSGENAHLVGIAADSGGAPMTSARIRATLTSELNRGVATTRSLTVESGARGVFAFCDLPAGWHTRVELLDEDSKVLGTVQVKTGPREAVWVDLRGTRP